jgi:hypothetical protein
MWTAVILAISLGVLALLAPIGNKVLNTAKYANVQTDLTLAVEGATAGLNIAKNALAVDKTWGDCLDTDKNCQITDSNGMYVLYSPSLGQDIENYNLGKVKLTVKMKIVNGDIAYVVSIAKTPKVTYYLGAKFTRSESGLNAVPIVYSPSSTLIGGEVCSYYYDGKNVVGETLPNFTVYLDTDFYWSPTIDIPNNPAGDNPKEVKFVTNFPTQVSGYTDIDEVFSTGDIYLQNGAQVGYVYSDGNVYIDDTSSADVIVENGNFQYPDFNTVFPDNTITAPSRPDIYCRNGQTIVLPSGNYGDLYVANSCTVILTGTDYTFNTIYTAYGSKVDIVSTQPLTTLEAKYIESRYGSSISFTPQDETASMTIKADTIYSVYASIGCTQYLRNCLIDTNDLYGRNAEFIGTTLIRDYGYLYGSDFIGNVFAESLLAYYSTFCNLVDDSGNQIIADTTENFYNIVAPSGLSLPVPLQEVLRVICSSETDCLTQLQ